MHIIVYICIIISTYRDLEKKEVKFSHVSENKTIDKKKNRKDLSPKQMFLINFQIRGSLLSCSPLLYFRLKFILRKGEKRGGGGEEGRRRKRRRWKRGKFCLEFIAI